MAYVPAESAAPHHQLFRGRQRRVEICSRSREVLWGDLATMISPTIISTNIAVKNNPWISPLCQGIVLFEQIKVFFSEITVGENIAKSPYESSHQTYPSASKLLARWICRKPSCTSVGYHALDMHMRWISSELVRKGCALDMQATLTPVTGVCGENTFLLWEQSPSLCQETLLPVEVRCYISCFRGLARDARCNTMSHLTADAGLSYMSRRKRLR